MAGGNNGEDDNIIIMMMMIIIVIECTRDLIESDESSESRHLQFKQRTNYGGWASALQVTPVVDGSIIAVKWCTGVHPENNVHNLQDAITLFR